MLDKAACAEAAYSGAASSSTTVAPMPTLTTPGTSTPASSGVAPPTKSTVKGDTSVDNELKKFKQKKALQLALRVIARSTTRRLWAVMAVAPHAIMMEHFEPIKAISTKRHIKSWIVGLSCGSFNTYLAKVASVVRDREALEKCGLVQDDMFKDASSSRLQEEMVACKALVDLLRDVFDNELRHVRFYVDRPPYRFAALSGRMPGEPTRTLGWSKKLLAALRKLEAESLKDKWYDQYVDETLWPRSVLVQELLTGMGEAEFRVVPDDIQTDINDMVAGYNSSVIAENGFRKLDEFAQTHRTRVQSRITRWQRLSVCGILEDHDRIQPPITPEARAQASSSISASTFQASKNSAAFTLGEEALGMLENKKVRASHYLHNVCVAHAS